LTQSYHAITAVYLNGKRDISESGRNDVNYHEIHISTCW